MGRVWVEYGSVFKAMWLLNNKSCVETFGYRWTNRKPSAYYQLKKLRNFRAKLPDRPGVVWVWYGSGMGRTSTQDFGDMGLSLKTVKQQKVVESKKRDTGSHSGVLSHSGRILCRISQRFVVKTGCKSIFSCFSEHWIVISK